MKSKTKREKQTKNKDNFNLNNFIYSNFKQGLKDLKSINSYLIFISLLFLSITILASIFPIFFREEMFELIKKILMQTENLEPIELTRFIIANNIKSSFFALIFGILLGIVPLVVAITNAYVLGFVINESIAIKGVIVVLRLFPHGIFELPAIIISISLGLKLGWFPIIYHKKNKKQEFINLLKKSLRIFILIVIPLLVIAGIIEGSLIWWMS